MTSQLYLQLPIVANVTLNDNSTSHRNLVFVFIWWVAKLCFVIFLLILTNCHDATKGKQKPLHLLRILSSGIWFSVYKAGCVCKCCTKHQCCCHSPLLFVELLPCNLLKSNLKSHYTLLQYSTQHNGLQHGNNFGSYLIRHACGLPFKHLFLYSQVKNIVSLMFHTLILFYYAMYVALSGISVV